MTEIIHHTCLLAICCGFITELCPKGNVKRLCSLLGTVIVLLYISRFAGAFDEEGLRTELSRLREEQESVLRQGTELRERLDRLVIQQELETYIWDKAAESGAELSEVRVHLIWSTEGFWIPDSVELTLKGKKETASDLVRILEAELGLGPERQIWHELD